VFILPIFPLGPPPGGPNVVHQASYPKTGVPNCPIRGRSRDLMVSFTRFNHGNAFREHFDFFDSSP
jgi:hypothetical protein